jgi:hypothetical protein
LRPTVAAPTTEPDEPIGLDENDGESGDNGESRGDVESRPKTTRRKRTPPAGKTRARNLHLPDDLHDRLWQYARRKKLTVSAAAIQLLDRSLPTYEVRELG